MPDFLVRLTLTDQLPGGEDLHELIAAEQARARALAADGVLLRLWRPEGQPGNIGLWSAATSEDLETELRTLPLWPYMRAEVTALNDHPYDPAGTARAPAL